MFLAHNGYGVRLTCIDLYKVVRLITIVVIQRLVFSLLKNGKGNIFISMVSKVITFNLNSS